MRKKLAFALAMMMLLTSLTACGGKDNGASSESEDGSVSSAQQTDGTVSAPVDADVQPEDTTGEQDAAAQETEAQPESKPQQAADSEPADKPAATKPADKPTAGKPAET
ncbi:MAG: hypothetical protein ACI3XZ_03070, partial [Butyricicoccus sp.]